MLVAMLSCTMPGPALASPSDAWITTKIKLALLTTEGVSGTAVRVDTINHRVTLHGKVRSGEEREKAESVAKTIDGVQGMVNLLEVVARRNEKAVQRSDDRINKGVTQALKANASLNGSSISLKSVNNGVVLLVGTAKTLADHLSAVEVAAGVPGVRRITSEIQSPDTLTDAEIWRDAKKAQVSNAAYGVGNASRDVYITSMTKMRLLADSRTPALDINVDTRDGVVTLFGMVPGKEAKRAAEADARKVSGVKRVMNELQVVSSATQPAVKANDDDIERDMRKTFQDHADFKDISIQVKNCAARLTGTVSTGMDRLEAAMVARATQGVCSVQDDLRIAD
ncbi:MAG: BON domain-containing protein [Deltaproteobacteria bacterium]|nr:BON domain-containing protein [Deltaproteobacteria bacterium]